MVLVDVNLLVYAVFADSSRHAAARTWLDAALGGSEPVALPWAVLAGFIRISTNPRVMTDPLTLDDAISHMVEWLALPVVNVIGPTLRHGAEFARMLRGARAIGNLVTDAHLAALSVEHGCKIASTDKDFAKFPGLSWFNLLQATGA
jgi:toxin-antitoxin system PIN domain toxin